MHPLDSRRAWWLVVVICATAAGCIDYSETHEEHAVAAWSDDQALFGFAVSECEHREPDTDLAGSTTRCDLRVGVRAVDGGEAQELAVLPDVRTRAREVYVMRSAGYLLVRADHSFRVDLADGEVVQVEERAMAALPSREGLRIGLMERCDVVDGQGFGIRIVDAETLEPSSDVHCLAFPAGSPSTPELSWDVDGRLVVWNDEASFAIDPDGDVTEGASPPACGQPTSSGPLSAEGHLVDAEITDGVLTLRSDPDPTASPDPPGCVPAIE